MNFLSLFFAIHLISNCTGYKFLVIFPLPTKSLNILGEGAVNHLLHAGHEITYITVFPIKKRNEKLLHQIDVSNNLKMFEGLNITLATVLENVSHQKDLHLMRRFALDSATATFKNDAVKKFLADKSQKFDAVIADYFDIDIYAGLAALYDCPMIWSYSMGAHSTILRQIDEYPNPAYVPDYLSSNIPPLTFVQRLEELWSQIQWIYVKRFYSLPEEEIMYKTVFEPLLKQRGKSVIPYTKLIHNASLILANDHTAAGNVPKLPANFKFIGGQHIESPTKPLPEDLQSLMDNASHGVIYFSLGSTFQSKDMPKIIIDKLLKVFGELKQFVLWKFEENLQNLPSNVRILKWAPQLSILNHPKCLFFISHGGLLSSMEAVHYAKPVIGIPIYLDQFVNINKAVAQGYALKVDLNYNLANQLKTAINLMLSDETYMNKAKELSMIYHDRPVTPGAELVHWVEHVVRTRGAPHLRSPALQLPFYQKMYLDLLGVVIVPALILIHVLKKLFHCKVKTNKYKKNN